MISHINYIVTVLTYVHRSMIVNLVCSEKQKVASMIFAGEINSNQYVCGYVLCIYCTYTCICIHV